jgi:phosphate/phosphite/phosphonate ABC transporter binding protein
MMRKSVYGVFAVLLITAMLLAACKPAETPQPTAVAEGPVVEATAVPGFSWEDVDPNGQNIVFWHQHSGDRETALLEIVDEFNQSNEWGITVTAEYQGSYNDVFNKMLGVLNTTEAPDVVVAYQNQAATYQLSDALVDMNGFVDSAKWGLSAEDQADFFPGFFAQDVFPNFGNQRLGFPPNRSMEVLYYNMDWLKELGFNAPPTTPDQFKEMACKAVEQPFSKATVEGAKGYELSIDASRMASWTFAFGGDIYDYDKAQFTYNSEASNQAMSFISDMFTSGCATQVVESYGDQTDFGNGSLLFAIGSSSGLPYYGSAVDEGAKFEWSVAAIPYTTEEPVMNVYGASVSIPVTTPERELAAWLFIKYYTSQDVQAKWATASQYFPVRQSVVDGLTEVFNTVPGYKTAFEMLKYSHFEPPVPGYDFVRNSVTEAMAAIVDGADVATTLDALNTDANEQLAEQLSQTSAPPPPTPEPTAEPTPEVVIGTVEHPIKVLFVPSVDAQVITTGGELMAEALKEATGLEFVVSVPTSYAATVEEMCASPADSMGFIPATPYVLANQLCGVDVSFKAVRRGFGVYWAQILVARDSDIKTIEDLNGKKWGYPDAGSTSGYQVPAAWLADLGIVPGEMVETGGHNQSVAAVYNGDVDFSTSFYSPPAKPEGETPWVEGDPADIPDDLISECAVVDDDLVCGGWTVLDARANIRTEAPDVVQKVKILALTPAIPNDTLSFGPDFPADIRALIEQALIDYSKTDGWKETIGHQDFYNWTGLEPAVDADYDVIRLVAAANGTSLDNFR